MGLNLWEFQNELRLNESPWYPLSFPCLRLVSKLIFFWQPLFIPSTLTYLKYLLVFRSYSENWTSASSPMLHCMFLYIRWRWQVSTRISEKEDTRLLRMELRLRVWKRRSPMQAKELPPFSQTIIHLTTSFYYKDHLSEAQFKYSHMATHVTSHNILYWNRLAWISSTYRTGNNYYFIIYLVCYFKHESAARKD